MSRQLGLDSIAYQPMFDELDLNNVELSDLFCKSSLVC
jgi:hypothetical protein